MKLEKRFAVTLFLTLFLVSACSSPAPTPTETNTANLATETAAATATASPEPSPIVEPVLDLEILEWYEHPIANLVDPSITDKQVEVLIHNPNAFPVRINTDEDELRFLNAEGHVVYTNDPTVRAFEGEWITPGQNAAYSACVCFQTQGLEKQEWVTLELVAPIEVADDLAYTTDVELEAGFVNLEDSGPGMATTLTNTSDQVLESIPMLVFARDASGQYVGMALFGDVDVSFFNEDIGIQPGDTASGFGGSNIDYLENERLTYEVAAIGIIARGTPTAEPLGEPAAEWQGIPIMPGAISGGEVTDGGYDFTTQATVEEIMQFYKAALAELGYSLTRSGEEAGVIFLFFEKGSSQAVVAIRTAGDLNRVKIAVLP